MKKRIQKRLRGWLALLVLGLGLMGMGTTDAVAQSQRPARGGTQPTESGRTERKAPTPRKEVKKEAPKKSTTGSRTESRTPARTESRGTARTQSRGTARSGSRGTVRSDSQTQGRSGSRGTGRTESQGTTRSGSRGTVRTESRTDGRSGSRTESRGTGRTESQDTVRSGDRTGSRGTVRSGDRTESRGTVRSGDRTNRGDDRSNGGNDRVERRKQQTQAGRRAPSQTQRAPVVVPPRHQPQRPYKYKGHHKNYKKATYYRHRPYANHHRLVGPQFEVHIHWPWQYRQRHHWRPQYRYRQIVYVEVGTGHNRRRSAIDVRTTYRHEVRHATYDYAEIDIRIEDIELYADGRYVGSIHHIPSDMERIRATVFRDGRVHFDRDLFVVGDPYAGFELISTQHYNDYVLSAYERGHDYRVARLDLRRERAVPVSRSNLFRPYDRDGYAPVSLLPENEDWLWDYGYGAAGGYGDDYFYGDNAYGNDSYYGDEGGYSRFSVQQAPGMGTREPLRNQTQASFRTNQGTEIRFERQTEFQRIN